MRFYHYAMFLSAISTWQLAEAEAEAQGPSYVQQQNVVYAEVDGVGLLMDVFTPRANRNGFAIVDVISGAWYSDRGKVRDHARAQTFEILCRKGYTVFAVRPGSISKFSAPEMLANLQQGVRWVKEHANEWMIDPDRLGLMGASAGGHLACLLAVTSAGTSPGNHDGPSTSSTAVKAVAVFFPPTDFLNFGGQPIDVHSPEGFGPILARLAFAEGLKNVSSENIETGIRQISPARLVTPNSPPFLLVHGDADPVVPLQQSEVMRAALQQAGVPVELIVKSGGGHPWPTLHEEIEKVADWFDLRLGTK